MLASKRRSWIALLLAVSLVAGTLVVGGAVGQEGADTTTAAPAQDTAYLRVAHVSPDAPPVDVFVDGERILANVSFGDVSDYAAFPADTYNVSITPAGDNETVVFEGNLTLEARSVSTLFASGEVAENASQPFEPVLFSDDAFTPDANESAVSVAHMSPDAPAVDVTADNGSVVLAENLTFQEASDYVNVPDGDHTVEIRPASPGANATPVATVNVSLDGGTAYSALAIGYLDVNASPSNESFQVTLVEDASKTVTFPATPETPMTETETPMATETPGMTETATPETTETPMVTETPGMTETATPETTETPMVTETPGMTETETAGG